jgi:hypothetical protein
MTEDKPEDGELLGGGLANAVTNDETASRSGQAWMLEPEGCPILQQSTEF